MKLRFFSLLLCLLLILCACAPVQPGETDAALTDKELTLGDYNIVFDICTENGETFLRFNRFEKNQ